ncbi:MAG: energy-coupling factor transporter ATPase [Clostridiales bacterium]|nr:energy-coupling factor transporter ATPase [Clostridiales bacterium]
MSVEIKNLSHVYMPGSPFEIRAVDDVSFDVRDGEFFGIIGHTGSGKSTLIQHLNGLLLPTGGSVKVNGYEISTEKKELKEIRRLVGMVFQYPEYQLFEDTVEKDVAFGPKNQGLSRDEIEHNVKESIEDVGLDFDKVRNMSPFELSGGQRRRVAIAGVLAMKPEVIIFDEPTAGLDPGGRELIYREIQQIKEKRGATVILVSHNMDDIARFADRIAVMDKGRLVCATTPKELFADEKHLEDLHLDLPQLTSFAHNLNKKGGFSIPDGIFEIEDMKNAVIQAVRRKKQDVQ